MKIRDIQPGMFVRHPGDQGKYASKFPARLYYVLADRRPEMGREWNEERAVLRNVESGEVFEVVTFKNPFFIHELEEVGRWRNV